MRNEADESPLAALGFDSAACEVYAAALRHGAGTRVELAERSGLTLNALDEAVAALVAEGLLRRVDALLIPFPPEEALTRLIGEHADAMREQRRRLENAQRQLQVFIREHVGAAPRSETVSVDVI